VDHVNPQLRHQRINAELLDANVSSSCQILKSSRKLQWAILGTTVCRLACMCQCCRTLLLHLIMFPLFAMLSYCWHFA